MSDDDRPLAGVRVLDLTRVVAGPHCTRMLAELGADVIKLEPPGGDQTRAGRDGSTPSPPGFVQLNLGKRLIAVDLAQPVGRDLVRRLAGAVDVLIENFRPGVMAAWGLDHAALAAECPRLIYVSISGYGQVGEWRERRAYAPFVHGEAGYLDTAAGLRSEPVEHDPMSIADLAAAKDATIALLAALVQRGRTGAGQHIDISLAHSILFLNEFASALLTPGTKVPKSGSTPQHIFTTSDGHRFSAGNPVSGQVFATLCRCFGCPELIDDERFADTGGRRDRRAELLGELQAALLRQGGIDEVEAVLDAAGLAVGRIRSVVDVPDTAWAAERHAVVTVDVDGSSVRLPSAPWLMSSAPPRPTPTMHQFGGDDDAVMAELLGLDDDAIAELRAAGVLLDGTTVEADA